MKSTIEKLLENYWHGDNSPGLLEAVEATNFLEKNYCKKNKKIGISSSITCNSFDIYLKWHAACNGVNLDVVTGGYDDPINDIKKFQEAKITDLIVMPHFDNLLPSLESQMCQISNEKLIEIKQMVQSKYKLLFNMYSTFNSIHVFSFHQNSIDSDANSEIKKLDFINELNIIVTNEAKAFPNIKIINSENAIKNVGLNHSFNYRDYYKGKAPYSSELLNEFSRMIIGGTRAFNSYFYKALVLDCDNTLWGGIIGEDLLNGIKLSPYDYPGNVFWKIQNEFSNLEKSGILICLCSKNNPHDVDAVFSTLESIPLKDSQIILKKVNWVDKAKNIKDISVELNIGLDSLIFLDDSDFECESVKTQLPEVKVFKVPKNISEYPGMVEKIKRLFLSGGVEGESKNKTEQYKLKAKADLLKSTFENQEDYLRSLELKVTIALNNVDVAPRISELSQKSNQFNLTTRRYNQGEITALMESHKSDVYSFSVSDKFGDSGVTGAVIIDKKGEIAHVDSFFMSCRVIGRGVENSIWETIVADLSRAGYQSLTAEYIPTQKNMQVAKFFNELGFTQLEYPSDTTTRYECNIIRYEFKKSPWIEIICQK
jgi:FkbH-like protein